MLRAIPAGIWHDCSNPLASLLWLGVAFPLAVGLALCHIDGMRSSDTRFLLAWLLPVYTIVWISISPATAALGTLALWWSVALLDILLPGGRTSPSPVDASARLGSFRWLLRLYVPLQLLLIGVGILAAINAAPGDWLTVVGLAYSVGFITGSQGITFAHELGHSKLRIDRFCAWVLMTSVCYGHFMVEHYRGHHPRAATFEDPASARFGESLYRFLPRTLWGSLVSGWRLESQRLQQFRSTWLRSPPAWSFAASLMLIVLPAQYLRASTAMNFIAFFIMQSVVAFCLLEIVNYIEHYGLQRQAANGQREAFGVRHAWNADHLVTNSMLANLQRHSDHHMHAWKPYPTLAALSNGPTLPTGYAGCIMLALVPPLWFRMMHPRIAALSQPPQEGAVATPV
jgi:alkane 1-monooxygenase